MNPLDGVFLSAPLWLLDFLHILTLTLHLTAMNLLLGGLLWMFYARRDSENMVVRRFLPISPTLMAATVSLGVAPLLFIQVIYPRQIYAASIVSGWFWLAIVGAALLAYICLYAATSPVQRPTEGSPRLWALSLAMLSLLYISLMYSSVFALAEQPALIRGLYASKQSGWALNSDYGYWLLRWAHNITGALTVGGFFWGLLGRTDDRQNRAARRMMTIGMAAAFLFGLIYLLSLQNLLLPLMRTMGIWWLTLAIIAALAALHLIYKQKWGTGGTLLGLSLLGMVATRHQVRLLHLQDAYDPAKVPVHPQWELLVVFVLFLLLALGTIAGMLRMFFSRRELPEPGR